MHRLGALWYSTVLNMETTYTKIYDRKYLPLNLSSWNLTICRSIVKVLSTQDKVLLEHFVCVKLLEGGKYTKPMIAFLTCIVATAIYG
jgi:hypothetical protein